MLTLEYSLKVHDLLISLIRRVESRLITIARYIELYKLHEVGYLRRESLDLVVTQAQLS